MKPAIIVVDMVKDNFHDEDHLPITVQARAMIPALNRLLQAARSKGAPIIFACDSFLVGDFIFQGKMKAHSLRSTPGAEVLEDLDRTPADIFLPKRRFSAFFKTDLDMTLRLLQIDTVAVTGIATHFCVLTTALDALCHDFRAVILEDCSAGPTPEIHQRTLDNYRRNPLYPLLRVMDSVAFLGEF
ncbi:MAG TPA: isochorismatase family cysteine hydrolase [Thermodesulfobacteriota bacterium]|nr:isochorismatase family cysteine hydrolase [Thermodesulfobacteriota bacterium]